MVRLTKRESAIGWNASAPLDTPERPVPEKRAASKYPEAQLQRACVQYLRLRAKRGDLRFMAHNPERARTPAQQARAKAMGLEAGCADIIVFAYKDGKLHAHRGCSTIFIELKSPSGRLSPAQEDWRDWLTQRGWAYHVVRSVDELREIVG